LWMPCVALWRSSAEWSIGSPIPGISGESADGLTAVALGHPEMWRRAEADRIQIAVVVRLALAENVFAIAWAVQRLVR